MIASSYQMLCRHYLAADHNPFDIKKIYNTRDRASDIGSRSLEHHLGKIVVLFRAAFMMASSVISSSPYCKATRCCPDESEPACGERYSPLDATSSSRVPSELIGT